MEVAEKDVGRVAITNHHKGRRVHVLTEELLDVLNASGFLCTAVGRKRVNGQVLASKPNGAALDSREHRSSHGPTLVLCRSTATPRDSSMMRALGKPRSSFEPAELEKITTRSPNTFLHSAKDC